MIECEVKLSPDQTGAFLSVLINQPPDMRPTQYSLDEEGVRRDLRNASDFKEENCFFWAPGCGYEVIIDQQSSITIFAFSENASGIENLMNSLSELSVEFGYACDSDERRHRNKISKKMQYGIHESWVGRDFTKYLPGLYWITLIPVRMMSRLGLTLESIREVSHSTAIIGNINLLVRLYALPGDWRAAMGPIDAWCMKEDCCFSKKTLAVPIGEASDFIAMANILESFP